MAFSSQQAVPFGQRLLLRFSLPARRLWRRALLRPIGSAEGAGPRAWCLRGAGRVGSRVESHGWLSRRLPRPRRCATLAWGRLGLGGAAQRSGAEWSGVEWRAIGNDTRSRGALARRERGSLWWPEPLQGCRRAISCVGGGLLSVRRTREVPENLDPGRPSTDCPWRHRCHQASVQLH